MRAIISNGKIIARRAELITSRLRQARGLMFSKQKNLIFVLKKEKKVRMHMLFVSYPIDVIFLNSQKEVIELKKEFKLFRGYFSKHRARYILELEKKTIYSNSIKLGDRISFDPPLD